MYYFQKFFGDRAVPTTFIGNSNIVSYGSSFSSGEAGVVLVNKGTANLVVNVKINNFNSGTNYYYYTLNGGTDNGSFSGQVYVNGTKPTGATGGPSNYKSISPYMAAVSGGIKVTVPAYGAVFLVVADK
ncbi:MAG: hypothetical protein EOP51_30485 [Sphingobacteriales bacterium]|nr:MAG: hypothetical protein EOP51_30485 [Sphingobacteriales bacterium]